MTITDIDPATVDWRDQEAVAEMIDLPRELWHHQCHAVSYAIVQALPHGAARVARGWARGVGQNHSWVVLGMDCYDRDATIVDPTIQTYVDSIEEIVVQRNDGRTHRLPGGEGVLMMWGCPTPGDGPVIELTPSTPWSGDAQTFLRLFARTVGGKVSHAEPSVPNFDRRAWSTMLSEAPMRGWPAGEFIAAMKDTPEVSALVPIDLEGMLTDRNPGEVYLRTRP